MIQKIKALNLNLGQKIAMLFAITPLIINHLPSISSNFPLWAIIVLIGNAISFVATLYILFSFIRNRSLAYDYSFILFTLVGFTLAAILWSSSQEPDNFLIFGKGVSAVSVALILSLIPIAFVASNVRDGARKILFITSIISISIPLFIFVVSKVLELLKMGPTIITPLAYLAQPTFSFGGIVQFPLLYSVACLFGLTVAVLVQKFSFRSWILTYVNIILAIILLMISFIWTTHNFTRYAAANYYIQASSLAANNEIDLAIEKLTIANNIAPFDSYYLGLAELRFLKLQNMDPQKEETRSEVFKIISDLTEAYKYDSRNDAPLIYLYNFYNFLGAPNQGLVVLETLRQKYPTDQSILEAIERAKQAAENQEESSNQTEIRSESGTDTKKATSTNPESE